MFCKFCGQNIPDTSEFCPECGKKLKKEEVKEREHRGGFNVPLALMLIILCWSTLFTWARVLLYGDRTTIGAVISTIMLVVGLVLLGTLINRERICADDYRFSDLAVLCCVWMVIPSLVWRGTSKIVYYYLGQSALSAWNCWNGSAVLAIQFPVFWLVLGLIALGLARSGKWEPSKKQKTLLLGVLLLCSVVGFLFARFCAIGAPMEVVAMATDITRQWTILCWLWPLFILKVFRALGEGRIGAIGAAASLLGMQLGEILLLPLLTLGKIGLPMLGASGPGLANGISPLFGLMILRLAVKLHKKK